MQSTAVQELKSIDGIVDSVDVNKKELLRHQLDKIRTRHELVNQAADGRANIRDIVEELYREKYGGWRILLPRIEDGLYDQRLEEYQLEKLFDNANLLRTGIHFNFPEKRYLASAIDWANDRLMNPVVPAVIIGGLMPPILTNLGNSNYQGKIISLPILIGLCTALGAVSGLIGSSIMYNQMNILREQARYLQEKITQAYPTR